jgi:hypothetical protein
MEIREKIIYKFKKIINILILILFIYLFSLFILIKLEYGLIMGIFFLSVLVINIFLMKHLSTFEFNEKLKIIKFNGEEYEVSKIKSISLKKTMPYKETFIIFTNDNEYWIQNKHFKNKDFIQMKEILEKIKKELDDEKK